MQLLKTPEAGVPKAGVTNVGEVAKTNDPDPVSSVTTEAKFAEVGVAKKVATPVPRPETPVLIGSPVQFVSVPDAGVPSTGVVKDGEVERAIPPDPVTFWPSAVATPVPNEEIPVPPEETPSTEAVAGVIELPSVS